jgi:hypothetical protein
MRRSTLFKALAAEASRNQKAGTLEIRTGQNRSIKWHVCRIDERMIAVPYLDTKVGAGCPLFDLHKAEDGLFGILASEFDTIWASAARVQQK